MSWHFTAQVDEYAEHVWDLLAADPARNSLALTVIDTVRAGRRWSEDPMLFGWYDGEPGGAVSMTPPYSLVLASLPDGAVEDLVAALRTDGVALPGVSGARATTARFATAWTAGTALTATTSMQMRLYTLGELAAPQPPPPGGARLAERADLELVMGWMADFSVEAHARPAPVEIVHDRLEHGLMWLWTEQDGSAVSFASRSHPAAGVSRVGPVYTPGSHRCRGYGAAVTAACTADALAQHVAHVVLFTDLTNPTSNSIYQKMGYEPILDHDLIDFS